MSPMAVVLVTGGSSGIGLATVARLVGAGDRVFSLARRSCPVDGATSINGDLRERSVATTAVERVLDEAGQIDALVSNAGHGALSPIEELGDDEVEAIFDVNVLAPLRLARAALPSMRERGGGRIVHVTSMNDVLPAPFGGHYSASKAALASASAVLDAEVRPFGVTVTVVAPGLFRSEMTAALGSYEVDGASPYATAFGRVIADGPSRLPSAGDPDDVAAAIESILRAEDPPARVVVGADARAMAALVEGLDAEALARRLRDFVIGLTSSDS
jgi:NAD(P)-dependent dehydrogenase (short-subunit alcohol dehydrogenase family)